MAREDRSVELANQIIEKLEVGVIPWRSVYGSGRTEGGEVRIVANPANVVSLHPYEGRNYLSALTCLGLNGWTSGWFATFKQWQQNDCMVRRGERSMSVLSWREMQVGVDPLTGQPEMEWVQRWFNVFNIQQVEPLSDKGRRFLEMNREIIKNPVTMERTPLREVDQYGEPYIQLPMLDGIPATIGCGIDLDAKYTEAQYDEEADTIRMPPMNKFVSSNAYYTTLLHECVHATMKQHRCARLPEGVVPTEEVRAREELIAEFACMLLADKFGTVAIYLDNHAGYIQHWIRALQAEPKYIKDIMGDAVKAQRFILKALGVGNGRTAELEAGDSADQRAEGEAERVPA